MREGLSRIAGRIFTSYVYRPNRVKVDMANSAGNRDGILMLDYRKFPLFWAYLTGEGLIRIVSCLSENDAYDKYLNDSSSDESEFVRKIDSEMYGYNTNVRNFRISVAKILLSSGANTSAEEFLMESETVLPFTDARNMLTRRYDLSLDVFEKVFGSSKGEEGVHVVSAGGFDFYVNGSDFTDDEIKSFASEVVGMIPERLSKLCYGKVEVKGGFSEGNIGDYNRYSDIIRTGGNREEFIGTMVHELGHRWRYKFAGNKELANFRKAFREANGTDLKFNGGDIIECYSGQKYKFIAHWGKKLYVEKVENGEKLLFKSTFPKYVKSINGVETERFCFPSSYAGTDVDEFIAECFEMHCQRQITDPRLERFLEENFV